MFVTLAPWDKRQRTQKEITAELNRKLQSIPGIQVFAFTANSLGIRGGGQGLQFAITGNDYADARRRRRRADRGDAAGSGLRHGAAQLRHHPAAALDQDRPRPRRRRRRLGRRHLDRRADASSPARTSATSTSATTSIEILAQAPDGMIQDPSGLERVQLKGSSGKMVPLSSLVTFEEMRGRADAPAPGSAPRHADDRHARAGRRPPAGDDPSRGDRAKRTCRPAWASSTPARRRS